MNATIKKTLGTITVLALVFGIYIGVNAREIKVEPVQKVVVTQTWYYNGGPLDSPTDASKYSLDANELCGGEPTTICKILAPADPLDSNIPHMEAEVDPENPEPQTVADQITEALSSTPTENATVQSFRDF